MSIFKVTYLQNEILSCHAVHEGAYFDGNNYFEHDTRGQLIFAIIKAANEQDAKEIALSLVGKVAIAS